MNRNIHDKIILLGIIAPILFFILMYFVFPVLYPGYSFQNQHISQLGAIDSPIKLYANFFGFYLFGVLLILFSLAIFRLPQLSKGHKISSVLLLMTGIVISLISFFPCDVSCNAVSQTGFIHLILAGVQLFFLVSTVFVFSFSKPLDSRIGRFVKILFFIWLIPSLIWFLNIIFNFQNDGVGLIQRVSLAITYFFVVVQGMVYYQYHKGLKVLLPNKDSVTDNFLSENFRDPDPTESFR